MYVNENHTEIYTEDSKLY